MAKSAIILFLILGILPFPVGCVWISGKNNGDSNPVRAYLYGLFTMITVFQAIAVPMSYQRGRLSVLVRCWMGAVIVLAVAGLIRSRLMRAGLKWLRSLRKKCTPVLIISLICMLLQAGYVTRMQHIDEDDAYYLGTSVTTVSSGRLYTRDSYTGKRTEKEPLARYALASWPIFLAALSDLSGMQAVILAHMVLPSVTLLWVYLIYALTGAWIFPGEPQKQGWFLFFTVMLFSFSGYSVYSAQVFSLIRGWQGKAVLCGTGLPSVIYGCLRAFDGPARMRGQGAWPARKKEAGQEKPDAGKLYRWNERWTVLLMTTGFCTCLSSIGVALSGLIIGAFALYWLIRTHSLRQLANAFLACLPAVLTGCVYLLRR